jgi:hypothetical protein
MFTVEISLISIEWILVEELEDVVGDLGGLLSIPLNGFS